MRNMGLNEMPTKTKLCQWPSDVCKYRRKINGQMVCASPKKCYRQERSHRMKDGWGHC
jgi:hypothetical protein